MKILSLGLSGEPEEVRAGLEQECRLLTQSGFPLVIEETRRGRYVFFGFSISDGELSFRNYERVKSLLKAAVARILTEYILAGEERRILRRIVSHSCCYFAEPEQNRIFEAALSRLARMENGNLTLEARFAMIAGRVQAYFDHHQELVLDGFIAFRLKDYRDELSALVDHTVDEYMQDMEYQEFVRVLRYFVDVQEAQVDEVHVLIGEEECFRIHDAKGRSIPNHYLERCLRSSGDGANYEDILISALITIAPHRILLHVSLSGRPGVVATIQKVFGDKVSLCEGCEICSPVAPGQAAPDRESH